MGYNASIPKLFAAAQTAIYNAQEQPEIQKSMNTYGFSPKRLLEGKSLLESAMMLHYSKDDRYDEKREIANQLAIDLETTRRHFEDHVATVKLAFRKAPATLAKFRIRPIAKKMEGWTLQASRFYDIAETYADVLENYQLPREELSQNKAMVEALRATRNQRMQKKGEAEEATRVRDEAVNALNDWMVSFRGIARIALKDKPQLLEALGIKVKTRKA